MASIFAKRLGHHQRLLLLNKLVLSRTRGRHLRTNWITRHDHWRLSRLSRLTLLSLRHLTHLRHLTDLRQLSQVPT